MKLSARSAAWVLPFLLTACFHRSHPVQNQQLAPPLPRSQSQSGPPVSTTSVDLPPSTIQIPTQPTANAQEQPEKEPRPHHRRPHAAKPAQEDAASAEPPAVSAIGQLSSGDPIDYRRQTEDSIISIEKGLSDLHRSLSSPEQKTADHIREFLKQARSALASGDVDGAHTLAAKAKVLLDELTQ